MSSGKRSASRQTANPSATDAKRARREDANEQTLSVETKSPPALQPNASLNPIQFKSRADPIDPPQKSDGTGVVKGPQSSDIPRMSRNAQDETESAQTVQPRASQETSADTSSSYQEEFDDGFDIVQPTLIKQLRKILDQYSDGQILKELIQNAEDAGASQVKFLCDYHRYRTEKLHHAEMDKFQGPALYAYNNETFTTKDWKGIRMLSDSIKDKDPMKVGRFGLGFKSVYHMTDLPSIVSNEQVGMLDPHEKYFSGGTGHRWRFKKEREIMNEIPDQFAPYEGIFGFGAESYNSHYEGTLFRFPLREEASLLSDDLYSPDKVLELLQSFKDDADMVLLFLKNLESIELYVREEKESSPRKTFEVKISENSLQNVRTKRKEFVDKISCLERGEVPSSPVSVTYPITIECTSYEGDGGAVHNSHRYLLTNYFSGGQMSSNVKTLMEAEALSYLPWVGVAMAVERMKTTVDPTGHLFCFLPLPMQKKSLTGLPVHVNGFFALSQDRRDMKWPTADQEDGGKKLTDKALRWNKFLVKEVVPLAYVDLLMESKDKVPLEVFYEAWPDPTKSDPKWQEMLPLLFEQLLKCATFYTPADSGTWLQVNEAIFDTLKEDDETRKILLNALKSANQKIVTTPQHVMDVIAHNHTVDDVKPALVRDALRGCPSSYVSRPRSEKLLLLKYILKDSCFADLCELELLPLSDKTFTKFLHKDHPSCEPIYISSKEHPQSLLPGLDHLFLDSESEIGTEICLQLKKAAASGDLQLHLLDENAVIQLLPKSFPRDWASGDQVTWYPGLTDKRHPPEEWLKSLWVYLSQHFHDLSKFGNQPLVPVSRSKSKVTLARLRSPSVLVLESSPHGHLDVTVAKVLKDIGVPVISKLPQFVMSHCAFLGKYVHLPLVSSVLQAMVTLTSASGYQAVVQKLEHRTPHEKRALRVFFSKAFELSPTEKELVRHLPLLKTLEGSGSSSSRFVAAREISKAASREALPVKIFQELIDICHDGSESFARLSGVTMLNATELLSKIVFPDVQEQKYARDDVDTLMKHVFDHFPEYKKEMPRLVQIMKTLPFVTKRDGKRMKPSDLFNPTEPSLRNIFEDEDVFPSGPVYTAPSALAILNELGLKEEKDLKTSDVLRSVRHTENMQPIKNARRKALSLLSYLDSNGLKLVETVDGKTLGSWLRELCWVPTMTTRPSPSYPNSLPFCGLGGADLLKPTQVTSSKFVDVIGSAMPVVALNDNGFPQMADFFGWADPPDTKYVLLHLRNVVECYTQSEKPNFMIIVKKIYQHLLGLDSYKRTETLAKLHEEEWIWNGEGFSSHSSMVFKKPFTDLSPYICPLPSEVIEFEELFLAGGMRKENEKLILLRVLELMGKKYDKEQNHKSEDVKRDLQLSIDILNELKPSPEDCLELEVKERLLIPTHVPDDCTLCLAFIQECTYCDEEWLKHGHDASDVDEDGDMKIRYVHRNIPNDTAKILGVPSLMSRMLDADEFDVGEEFGQEEPLTCSIHRLLEGYTDGFAVPKELIQNADDAGATEVKFLYDQRTNEDSMSCLFDEGMKACQGPALWAFNNSVFTDEDFTNITKLNGATKQGDTEKIGRFGSGFNAVYNLTDVPSFVSRNSVVIFDPHKTHLGKAIQNGKPGIKINLMKNKQKLRKLANQFKPFNGIFGCDLRPEAGQDSYDGTLFRFPLRTEEQAVKSELKKLHYTDQEMRKLLSKLVEGAELLLIFTQTVSRVSIYHLPPGSFGTPQLVKLFEVNKSVAKVIKPVSLSFQLPPTIEKLSEQEKYKARQSSFLRASSHALKNWECSDECRGFRSSSMVIDVTMTHTEIGANFLGLKESKQESFPWLVSSAMGTTSALEYTKKDSTLLPAAGVAVRLARVSPVTFVPKPIVNPKDKAKPNGKMFCYLPLPSDSGFSVHVNGYFEVASNRRHLKERTEDDKYHDGDDWNEVLMKDAVSVAYISSLEDLKSLLPGHLGSFDIFELWPKAEKIPPVCQPLVDSFYGRLLVGPATPSLFPDSRWASIDEVVFLDPILRSHRKVGDIAFKVFKALAPDATVVVDLPRNIMESIRRCGYEDAIEERTFCTERFYRKIFLPHIADIPRARRDPLVLYAIDEDNLRALLDEFPSIPSSPEGKNLKRPRELVHPSGHASSLYGPEDGMFPHGTKKTFLSPARLEKLTDELGMRKDQLTWEEVLERAKSVQTLNQASHDGALKRTKALIRFLNLTLTANHVLPSAIVRENVRKTTFLPVLQKPDKFPLSWKGDVYGSHTLLAPKDVFQQKDKNLVSCIRPMLDDSPDGCGCLSKETVAFLGFREKHVCLDDVKAQLLTAITSEVELQDADNYRALEELLHSVYRYLQEHLHQTPREIISFLEGKTFILGETHFLQANQVAFEFQGDLSPYLHKLPRDLASKFLKLMIDAGVRQSFDVEDYKRTLVLIKEKFQDGALDNQSLKLTVDLASLIDSCSKKGKLDIYLPDTEKCLYRPSELCVRDCYWIMPDEEEVKYAHPKIPQETCINLGVNKRREATLRKCSEGIAFGSPFGQREELTTRIRSILTAYPCEKELLKELLQNADDAQATELCFIKDPRQHGMKRVFEDSWKPLQGPALCVFNNKPFTKADIRGIQNLGQGSKGDDPNKTGQYGVGFNAVYHLTDAPSFLSKGSEIGEVLCVFDPQCKFVPGATLHEPGQMFKDVDRLRGIFTDIFPCYLGEHFPVDNATMFRFPLRSKELARESSICENPVTVTDLTLMMEKFKSEMFDTLLFVNNVMKITLCEIDRKGKLGKKYEVTATLSDEDARKRTEFSSYVTDVGSRLRQKHGNLSMVSMKEVTYVVDLQDNKGRREKWLVAQRIGFEPGVDIPSSLQHAFRRGDLTLLPRGGVASLVKRSPARPQAHKPKKAFCFLPLPSKTGLPVHINGHFALDHEARRNLWRDDGVGYRSDWNNTLLTHVVAPCYVTLLTNVRQHVHLPLGPDGVTRTEKKLAQKSIDSYWALFPSLDLRDPYWVTLSKAVYRYVESHSVRLLPVLRSRDDEAFELEDKRDLKIIWLPPTGKGQDEAFFNNLNESYTSESSSLLHGSFPMSEAHKGEPLRSILLNAGFNLVIAPQVICDNFKRSGVSVEVVSPRAVLEFFRSYSSLQPLCRLTNLPVAVEDTALRDVDSVLQLLNYCKKDGHFYTSLDGVPLLVTEDQTLRVFDSSNQSFLTEHVNVLPQCASEFVHRSYVNTVFFAKDAAKYSIFKVFDVAAMASRLSNTLPRADFCKGNGYAEWNPLDNYGTPSKTWITQMWQFLYAETESVLRYHYLETTQKALLAEKLRPLNEWCLLPATEVLESHPPTLKHHLVPICMADTVVDFSQSPNIYLLTREALRRLSLPELSCEVIDARCCNLARMLVGSLDKPSQILRCLRWKLTFSSWKGAVRPDDCDEILRYFSYHAASQSLTVDDRTVLRMLPFYRSVSGDLINLSDRKVYVLKELILETGMGVWQRNVSAVFLQKSLSLDKLHTFLGCIPLGEVEFYSTVVFQHFGHLTPEDRLVHLNRLRNLALVSADRDCLLSSLKTLQFLPVADGYLQLASHFYDPTEPVFKTMVLASKFPPEPFSSQEWLPFLRQIGLVQTVTTQHIVSYAKEVAEEARSGGSDSTEMKSQVLINQLFKRRELASEGLLVQIRRIPFICPYKVPDSLTRVQKQFGRRSDGTQPYICFEGAVPEDGKYIAWTSANLLPRTADPRQHHVQNSDAVVRDLGILEEPRIEQVISHCEHVFCDKLLGDNCADKERIVTDIYRFLQNHQTDEGCISKLRHIPCVLVEDNRRLVPPCRVVIELKSDQEIRPYLFKIPATFAIFQDLLVSLGSTLVATADQFAAVLMAIYQKSGDKKLGETETENAFKAVKGLFETLEEDKTVTVAALYLPGTKKDDSTGVFISNSSELVYDDAPQFRQQIQGFREMLLVDLKKCGLKAVNFEVLVNMLPEALRPRMLTSLVQEHLSDCSGTARLRGKAYELRQLLKSQQFSHAIVRLIRHGDCKAGRRTEEGILAPVQKSLNAIQVQGVEALRTYLSYQGKLIPESEMEKTCFAEKTSTAENDQVWKVYLETSGGHEKTWISQVAGILNDITGGLLKDALVYLPGLLTCVPQEIWSHLDALGITSDETCDFSQTARLSQPGDFINIKDHYLLINELEDFKPGESVGYEVNDPSLASEDPVYIYAVIIDEVKPEGEETMSFLTKRYTIDVGSDKDVDAVDLYKMRGGDDANPDGCSSRAQPTNLEEEMEKITKLLEEAWKCPKEKRNKIIKRLYLTWHPSKNPKGNEEVCSEVFKFLQSKIKQLESEGQRITRRSSAASASGCGDCTPLFESWDRRANKHRESEKESQANPEDRVSRANPQPGQAKRWFRQAEADLKAASSDFTEGQTSYEWVCFKCHQAAEKALKAAQYFIDANRKTRQHNLYVNARGLGNDELSSLASDLERLLVDSTNMRYPDRTRYPQIPNDVYDRKMATEARSIAEGILKEARKFIESGI